ncbi:TIGR04141 family sporadically distributed protein [Streptacidiphilus anmyonensis]|uniref:TIGR04141 family sporadically distributed protein n=1 Tax=Streptacidiphilus anmyonensis TaxID=405782 RepID=UPI000A04CBA5|nr:TIGR04141 family sporadically distributed protein [Streptacidiphilus anmyonensis]
MGHCLGFLVLRRSQIGHSWTTPKPWPRYGDHIRTLYTNKWGDVNPVEKNRRMVLAIATDKTGDLADSLYFFSKVNLVQKLSDFRRSGFRVALAKVDR